MSDEFTIKDSGDRASFAGGMVRDTAENKTNYLNVRFGPMLKRWAAHLTKGREKYPDPEPGVPNWTLAEGREEQLRFQESAARHFEAWLAGDRDEDHAAGVFFNINGAEYVRDKLETDPLAKFHEALKKLPPVTSDDDPDAECLIPPGVEVADFLAERGFGRCLDKPKRCHQQCLRFNPATGGGTYIGCVLDKGHEGDHEAYLDRGVG